MKLVNVFEDFLIYVCVCVHVSVADDYGDQRHKNTTSNHIELGLGKLLSK